MRAVFSKILMIFAIVIIAANCKSSDTEDDALPACIENKIAELLSNEVANPPTQVWKWEVDGKIYFYITADCCDQYNMLYSENCEIVCAPDGGLTGEGDGNCPDFKGEIVKTLVWQDNR